MNTNVPLWILVKFTDKKVWLYSKNGRRPSSLMTYWRSKEGFKWCKVFNAKTKKHLFWFNSSDYGETDRQTSKKPTSKLNKTTN